jgi:hypothetical protein
LLILPIAAQPKAGSIKLPPSTKTVSEI